MAASRPKFSDLEIYKSINLIYLTPPLFPMTKGHCFASVAPIITYNSITKSKAVAYKRRKKINN